MSKAHLKGVICPDLSKVSKAAGGESQGRGAAVPLGYVNSACPWELRDDQGTNRKLLVCRVSLRRLFLSLRTPSF